MYNKDGNRIDVENPGNRQGQIHLQTKSGEKYIYNVKDNAFHINSSNGPLAPKSIQKLLEDPYVVRAIVKGLKILGYWFEEYYEKHIFKSVEWFLMFVWI